MTNCLIRQVASEPRPPALLRGRERNFAAAHTAIAWGFERTASAWGASTTLCRCRCRGRGGRAVTRRRSVAIVTCAISTTTKTASPGAKSKQQFFSSRSSGRSGTPCWPQSRRGHRAKEGRSARLQRPIRCLLLCAGNDASVRVGGLREADHHHGDVVRTVTVKSIFHKSLCGELWVVVCAQRLPCKSHSELRGHHVPESVAGNDEKLVRGQKRYAVHLWRSDESRYLDEILCAKVSQRARHG